MVTSTIQSLNFLNINFMKNSPSSTIKGHTIIETFVLKSDKFEGVAEIWSKNGKYDYSYEGKLKTKFGSTIKYCHDTNTSAKTYEECYSRMQKAMLEDFNCHV